MKRLLIAAIAAVLSACAALNPAPYITGQVTVYHQWTAQQARSYVLDTRDLAPSLEQQTLNATLISSLAKHGFSLRAQTGAGAAADLIITFSTQLDAKNMRIVDFVQPWGWWGSSWGGYGVYDRPYAHRSGTQVAHGAKTPSSPVFYAPLFAPTIPVERIVNANQRILKLMISSSSGQRLYEGSMVSTGSMGMMNDVLPALVDGLMQQFPGESAKSWSVRVPLHTLGAAK